MRRYVAIVAEGSEVFRMLQQNQAVVNSLATAKGRGELFRERMSALIEQLTELGGVSVGWMFSPARWPTAASSAPLCSASPVISSGPAPSPATPAWLAWHDPAMTGGAGMGTGPGTARPGRYKRVVLSIQRIPPWPSCQMPGPGP